MLTLPTCTCFWGVVISSAITILPRFGRHPRGCSTPRKGGPSPLLRRTGFSRHFPGNGAAPALHSPPANLHPIACNGQVLRADRHKRRHGGRRAGAAGFSLPGYRAALPWKRSEEHTSELQSLMRNSSAVFCLKQKTQIKD